MIGEDQVVGDGNVSGRRKFVGDGGGDFGVLRPGVIQSADLTGLNPCFNKMIVDKPHTVEDNMSVPPSSSFGEPGARPPHGGLCV